MTLSWIGRETLGRAGSEQTDPHPRFQVQKRGPEGDKQLSQPSLRTDNEDTELRQASGQNWLTTDNRIASLSKESICLSWKFPDTYLLGCFPSTPVLEVDDWGSCPVKSPTVCLLDSQDQESHPSRNPLAI